MTIACHSHFLCSSSTSSPAYTTGTGSGKESILLRGGFSGPEHETSVTLQLNGDLGCFSPAEMTAIGRAELLRKSSMNYRSTYHGLDSRLTVIASDINKLSGFCMVYSGLLELTPLLYGHYDSRYSCVEDLQADGSGNDLKITFTVRSPVDSTLCNYCGICGPICPEKSLTPELSIDFSTCSLCRKCEDACPCNAISLGMAEKRTIETPALLLLDENTKISLPADRSSIFRIEQINDYLSTLFDCRIDEAVTCKHSICQHLPSKRGGCSLCLKVCPVSAIAATDNKVSVDHDKCIECGKCFSICPTGAMDYQRFNDKLFRDYCEKLPITTGDTLVIGRSPDLQKFWWHHNNLDFDKTIFLEHPCVDGLHTVNFFTMIAHGAVRIIVLSEKITQQIRISRALLSNFLDLDDIILLSDTNNLARMLADAPVTTGIALFAVKKEGDRRRALSAILLLFQQKTEKEFIIDSKVDNTFGSIICDEKRCTSCFACLNVCKIKAMEVREDELALYHLPSSCVQCGACVAICPENALQMAPGIEIEPQFFKPSLLSSTEAVHCLKCGRIFGNRNSFNRVISLMKAKNMDTDLQYYCEECRIKRMFEEK